MGEYRAYRSEYEELRVVDVFAVIDLVIYRLQWSSSHLLVDQPDCRWISQSVGQSISQRATQSVDQFIVHFYIPHTSAYSRTNL